MSSISPFLFNRDGSLTRPFEQFCNSVNASTRTREKICAWALNYQKQKPPLSYDPRLLPPLVTLFQKLDLLKKTEPSSSETKGVIIFDNDYSKIQSYCRYLKTIETQLRCKEVYFLLSEKGVKGEHTEFIWNAELIWNMHRFTKLTATFCYLSKEQPLLEQWLKTSPEKGHYLVVTHAPYIAVQRLALQHFQSASHSFEPVGPPPTENKIETLLHALSLLIIQEMPEAERLQGYS